MEKLTTVCQKKRLNVYTGTVKEKIEGLLRHNEIISDLNLVVVFDSFYGIDGSIKVGVKSGTERTHVVKSFLCTSTHIGTV